MLLRPVSRSWFLASIMNTKRLIWAGVLSFSVVVAGGVWAQIRIVPRGKATLDLRARELTAPLAIRNQLTGLRASVAASGRNFDLAYTPALDFPLSSLAGATVPPDIKERSVVQNRIGNQLRAFDLQARDSFVGRYNLREIKYKPSPKLKSYDWRSQGDVTAVRNQNPCGTCWDFAPIAALEASNLIRNGDKLDLSEQQILDCAVGDNGADAGKCAFPPGGWHTPVMEYLVSHGTASEADLPYGGGEKACKEGLSTPYRASAWAYVTDQGEAGYNGLRLPTRDEMKEALCDHGPVAATLLATPLFQAYAGGADAFKENVPVNTLTPLGGDGKTRYHAVNHVILIIGWSDKKNAWLIKNSWGTGWGDPCGVGTERGYAWVDYDTNNLGYAAAWIDAKNKAYKLPPLYFQVKPNIRPFDPIVDAQAKNASPIVINPRTNRILPQLQR